jgi:hypothetical protein
MPEEYPVTAVGVAAVFVVEEVESGLFHCDLLNCTRALLFVVKVVLTSACVCVLGQPMDATQQYTNHLLKKIRLSLNQIQRMRCYEK